jgi:prohibitin 1
MTYRSRTPQGETDAEFNAKWMKRGIWFVVVGTLLILAGCHNPVEVVDEGHVGLVTRFGQAQEVRPPGMTLINPFTQRLIEVETRIRPIKFEKIEAASAEQQSVLLTGTMNFALQSDNIVDLYRRVGLDFQTRIVVAALNDTAKEVLPQYPVNEILPKRATISGRIQERLNERLGEYGITVTAIFLENIAFSEEFQKAIEAKQTAAQNAEREVQVTLQRTEQARQAIETARGQAEANRLLTESLSPEIVRYEAVKKWDGKLPVVQGDAGTIIDLGSVAPTQSTAPAAGASR